MLRESLRTRVSLMNLLSAIDFSVKPVDHYENRSCQQHRFPMIKYDTVAASPGLIYTHTHTYAHTIYAICKIFARNIREPVSIFLSCLSERKGKKRKKGEKGKNSRGIHGCFVTCARTRRKIVEAILRDRTIARIVTSRCASRTSIESVRARSHFSGVNSTSAWIQGAVRETPLHKGVPTFVSLQLLAFSFSLILSPCLPLCPSVRILRPSPLYKSLRVNVSALDRLRHWRRETRTILKLASKSTGLCASPC